MLGFYGFLWGFRPRPEWLFVTCLWPRRTLFQPPGTRQFVTCNWFCSPGPHHAFAELFQVGGGRSERDLYRVPPDDNEVEARLTCLTMVYANKITIWLVVWNMFFPYIGNNTPNWLIFFRGVETTNQWKIDPIFSQTQILNIILVALCFTNVPAQNEHIFMMNPAFFWMATTLW